MTNKRWFLPEYVWSAKRIIMIIERIFKPASIKQRSVTISLKKTSLIFAPSWRKQLIKTKSQDEMENFASPTVQLVGIDSLKSQKSMGSLSKEF